MRLVERKTDEKVYDGQGCTKIVRVGKRMVGSVDCVGCKEGGQVNKIGRPGQRSSNRRV